MLGEMITAWRACKAKIDATKAEIRRIDAETHVIQRKIQDAKHGVAKEGVSQ